MIDSWCSYPKVYALGHAAIGAIFPGGPVLVEEKIDGSQFSFGVFDGEIRVRSKGRQFEIDAADQMFLKATESVRELAPLLHDGWTYRAEYLQKPKHNVLAYDRIPVKHLIIFDINDGHESYLPRAEKEAEAERLGLEVVPSIEGGHDAESVLALLDRVSILGGQKIEGVVVKRYDAFTRDGKAMIGKYVTEKFKETHSKDWKKSNPTNRDIIATLSDKYTRETRWDKAVQHLREAGNLEGSPKDIGALLREVPKDIKEECAEEIKDALFEWAWPHIKRAVGRGLPEWYKRKLALGE